MSSFKVLYCMVVFDLLVDLAKLIERLQRTVPRVDIVVLYEMVHLVHDGHPFVGEVVRGDLTHADDELRADRIRRVNHRLDQVLSDRALVALVQGECGRVALGLLLLLEPELTDHVLQVDGARLSHRHLHLI